MLLNCSLFSVASYPVGTGGFFAVVKRPGRGADHSSPSSADVKNEWSCTFTPPYVFIAWCLIKLWISLYCAVIS